MSSTTPQRLLGQSEMGVFVALCGVSGAGKDELLRVLSRDWGIARVPGYTTRPRRHSEVDGLHYHFVDAVAFAKLSAEAELVDCLDVDGWRYGTRLTDLTEALRSPRISASSMTLEGALDLKRRHPRIAVICVLPPSGLERLRRVQVRGTSRAEMDRRSRTEQADMLPMFQADLIVVNHTNDQDETAARVMRFLLSEWVRPGERD